MPSGATARLFVAVELPLVVRERLCEWGRGVAVAARAGGLSPHALKLVGEDSLHLTLCFLGSRPMAETAVLADATPPAGARATASSPSPASGRCHRRRDSASSRIR
jgi:2'-5' RNA ligase